MGELSPLVNIETSFTDGNRGSTVVATPATTTQSLSKFIINNFENKLRIAILKVC